MALRIRERVPMAKIKEIKGTATDKTEEENRGIRHNASAKSRKTLCCSPIPAIHIESKR